MVRHEGKCEAAPGTNETEDLSRETLQRRSLPKPIFINLVGFNVHEMLIPAKELCYN